MNIKSIIIITLLIFFIFTIVWIKDKEFFSIEQFYPNTQKIAELGYADINDDYNYPTIYKQFVSPDEAEYIKNFTADKFTNSETVGGGMDLNTRKSKTAWIDKNDPVVKNIILRACTINNYPFENAEHLQVVKYGPNGFYNPHHDSTGDDNKESAEFLKSGGHRIMTMLIYLNDDFTGGATRFVTLEKDIKPPKYGSVLFYPLDKKNEKCHPKALHAGLPIESGEKYIANVWIRQGPFDNPCNY
jgi:prolyl 4-hydroxylase